MIAFFPLPIINPLPTFDMGLEEEEELWTYSNSHFLFREPHPIRLYRILVLLYLIVKVPLPSTVAAATNRLYITSTCFGQRQQVVANNQEVATAAAVLVTAEFQTQPFAILNPPFLNKLFLLLLLLLLQTLFLQLSTRQEIK